MQHRILLISAVSLCSACLFFGCAKKSEPQQKQAAPDPVAQAPAVAKENTQLAKAVAFHKTFQEGFSKITGIRNLDYYRRRVDYAEKMLGETNALLKESQDPQAQKFLSEFAFSLLRYADAGREVIRTGEQIEKNKAAMEEMKAKLENAKGPNERMMITMASDSIARGQSVFFDAQARNTGTFDKIERELRALK